MWSSAIETAFCSPPALSCRKSAQCATVGSPHPHSSSSRMSSLQEFSVSKIAAAVAQRGYRLQDASIGPLLKLDIYRDEDLYAGSISGAMLPSRRLHIESYKAARRDPQGGLLGVSPGMMLFIAALAYGYHRGARHVYGLAINDAPDQHRRLVKYLKRFGGVEVQRVTESLSDVPARMFYGGLGTVFKGDVEEMLLRGRGMLERTSRSRQPP